MMVYVVSALCIIGLISGVVYGVYMAIWGVHDEW